MHPPKVVVVGGGNSGRTIASILSAIKYFDVSIIEPFSVHYCPAMFIRQGSWILDLSRSYYRYPEDIPQGCSWIQDHACKIFPDTNVVETKRGLSVKYDALIMATGMQYDPQGIQGLDECFSSKRSITHSIRSLKTITKDVLQSFEHGHLVFSYPNGPIRSGSRLEPIVFMADDLLRQKGIRDDCSLTFSISDFQFFHHKEMFELSTIECDKRRINVNRHSEFKVTSGHTLEMNSKDGHSQMDFDLLYVSAPMIPEMSVQDANSQLHCPAGWVNVNNHSLQHAIFKNIFALGDCRGYSPEINLRDSEQSTLSQSRAISEQIHQLFSTS